MKSFKWIGFLTLVSCFFVIGCGGGGTETAPVAEQDEIAAWAAANPGEGEGLDPGVDADADADADAGLDASAAE